MQPEKSLRKGYNQAEQASDEDEELDCGWLILGFSIHATMLSKPMCSGPAQSEASDSSQRPGKYSLY